MTVAAQPGPYSTEPWQPPAVPPYAINKLWQEHVFPTYAREEEASQTWMRLAAKPSFRCRNLMNSKSTALEVKTCATVVKPSLAEEPPC